MTAARKAQIRACAYGSGLCRQAVPSGAPYQRSGASLSVSPCASSSVVRMMSISPAAYFSFRLKVEKVSNCTRIRGKLAANAFMARGTTG